MRTPFRNNHGKITFVLYNKPFPCGGNCLYCFKVSGLTKSTTINDDTELAKNLNWSGIKQISKRFEIYGLHNSTGNKCDLAVKGDSFCNHNPDYLRKYIKEIYDYLNCKSSYSLKDAAFLQKNAKNRCVTFKIETRPDHINIESCMLLLELGVTTVELGVQSLDEKILEINKRGHDLKSIENATRLLRIFGFEVVYQVMIGLPGSSILNDEIMLTEKLWEEPFSPDALKIYPCILLKNSVANQNKLYDLYDKKLWNPIDDTEYINLLKKCYYKIPRYVHINRIQRVIPAIKIQAGVKKEIDRNLFHSNSKCLWQRSIAQHLSVKDYNFQSYEIMYYLQGYNNYCLEAIILNEILLGYSRLSIISENCAIIRDIRVLGDMIPVGMINNDKSACQHIGIGTAMINKMEKIARDKYIYNIIVRPSYGTIDWFIKRGYTEIGVGYLGKNINYKCEKKELIDLPNEIKKMILINNKSNNTK